MTQNERDTSMELQPCEATTVTTRETRGLQEYLLPTDEPSQSSIPSRSSGVYTYAYDHMIDRFVAFLHVHLRHRQEMYSIRNQHSNSRPSSVPLTQAPSPPGQTPPSSPLIFPSPANEENLEDLQCSSTGDEYLEPKAHIHVTSSLRSSLYEEIPDDDRTQQYAEIT